MGSAYAGPKDARRYYYRCVKGCRALGPRERTGAYVPVRDVEKKAEPLIVARLQELKEELAREPKRAARRPAQDFAGRRAQIEQRRAKLLDLYLEGRWSKEILDQRMAKIDAEALRLDGEEQAALAPSPLADAGARRAVLLEVGAIAKAWRKAGREARREIVGHLVIAASVSPGKAPRFEWRPAEELLVDVA